MICSCARSSFALLFERLLYDRIDVILCDNIGVILPKLDCCIFCFFLFLCLQLEKLLQIRGSKGFFNDCTGMIVYTVP